MLPPHGSWLILLNSYFKTNCIISIRTPVLEVPLIPSNCLASISLSTISSIHFIYIDSNTLAAIGVTNIGAGTLDGTTDLYAYKSVMGPNARSSCSTSDVSSFSMIYIYLRLRARILEENYIVRKNFRKYGGFLLSCENS